jgi:hypothetical protein
MNAKDYLKSKAIFDNPRIVDSTGQTLDYYLEELLIEYVKQVKSALATVSLGEPSEATVCDNCKGYGYTLDENGRRDSSCLKCL